MNLTNRFTMSLKIFIGLNKSKIFRRVLATYNSQSNFLVIFLEAHITQHFPRQCIRFSFFVDRLLGDNALELKVELICGKGKWCLARLRTNILMFRISFWWKRDNIPHCWTTLNVRPSNILPIRDGRGYTRSLILSLIGLFFWLPKGKHKHRCYMQGY